MDPCQMIRSPCFALVMCTAHLLCPLYFKILDLPLTSLLDAKKLNEQQKLVSLIITFLFIHVYISIPIFQRYNVTSIGF